MISPRLVCPIIFGVLFALALAGHFYLSTTIGLPGIVSALIIFGSLGFTGILSNYTLQRSKTAKPKRYFTYLLNGYFTVQLGFLLFHFGTLFLNGFWTVELIGYDVWLITLLITGIVLFGIAALMALIPKRGQIEIESEKHPDVIDDLSLDE